jgi:hypothetical protein
MIASGAAMSVTKWAKLNSPRTIRRSAMRAFISVKLAIVLLVIATAGGMLAYEWHHADSAKTHYTSAHHRHHRDANRAGID